MEALAASPASASPRSSPGASAAGMSTRRLSFESSEVLEAANAVVARVNDLAGAASLAAASELPVRSEEVEMCTL